jgi:hypothetical protein
MNHPIMDIYRIVPNCIMKAKSERRRPFIGDQVEDCRDASGLFYILPFQKVSIPAKTLERFCILPIIIPITQTHVDIDVMFFYHVFRFSKVCENQNTIRR